MKCIRTNSALKMIALILSTILIVVFAVSITATVIFSIFGGYSAPGQLEQSLCNEIIRGDSNPIRTYILNQDDKVLLEGEMLQLPESLDPSKTNLRFTVTNIDGKTILTNEKVPSAHADAWTFGVTLNRTVQSVTRTFASQQEAEAFYQSLIDQYFIVSSSWVSDSTTDEHTLTVEWEEFTEQVYVVNYTVADPLVVHDVVYYSVQLIHIIVSLRWVLLISTVVSLIALILLSIYLCYAAGYRKGSEVPSENFIDRIPYDLYATILIAVGTFIVVGTWYVLDRYLSSDMTTDFAIFLLVSTLVLLVLLVFMLLSLFYTTVTRVKCKTIFSNTLIWKLTKLCCKIFCIFCKLTGRFLRTTPLYWKTGAVIVVLILMELLVLLSNSVDFIAFSVLVANGLLIPVALYCIVQYRKLRDATEKIAEGDTSYQIDTSRMVLDLKSHGEALNGISAGMQKAVNERMKSERFKTELITNVSHDIKTPLTSIINYVDLLKKEDIDSETAREYIAILDRQSARLKKLTEDLVEASKASTGNLTVHPEILNVGLLLNQTVAEFQERLDAKELTVIPTLSDPDLMVYADGRLVWRIMENLMSNVCKYAQEKTRVYLSTEQAGDHVRLIVKNTSKYSLNISSEELMERFTRGDASRHTEGSGLGLSIARSLTELQQGSFQIYIDGDLFKVIVELPAY